MPVSIQMPTREESGIDKFLRRLGGVANITASGMDIYDKAVTGPMQRKLLEAQVNAYPAEKAQKEADTALRRKLEEAQLAEIQRKPFKEEQDRLFKEKEYTFKAKESDQAREEKKQLKLEDEKKKKQSSMEEVNYRTKSINSNLESLKQLISDYGTFELTGPQSEQMDRLIYDTAIDYAKLVDPDSVAREGEVVAAQKYMLPVKGLKISNSSAIKLVEEMQKKANERAVFLNESKGLGDLIQSKPQSVDPKIKQIMDANPGLTEAGAKAYLQQGGK